MTSLYHYSECGLTNIHLKNGFEVADIEGEEFLSIEDIHGLHVTIAQYFIGQDEPLSGSELRFLRKLMNMSRRVIGDLFGVDQQTVGRWENGETSIPKTVDATLRQIYLESLNVSSNLTIVLQRLIGSRDTSLSQLVFEFVGSQWKFNPELSKLN
ncbi:helix-turn-helix domain-containing protein [Vibrio parahaemolyticus]|nr:helix-turn-helix domain-containing protein [Vibrio parahaemolyticus]